MPPKGKKKGNKKGGDSDEDWGDKDNLTLDAVAKKVGGLKPANRKSQPHSGSEDSEVGHHAPLSVPKQSKGGKKAKPMISSEDEGQKAGKAAKPQQQSGKKGQGKKPRNQEEDEENEQSALGDDSDQERLQAHEPSKQPEGGKKGKAAVSPEDKGPKTTKSQERSPKMQGGKKCAGKKPQNTKWDEDEESQSSEESGSEPEMPSQLTRGPPGSSKQAKRGKKGKAVMDSEDDGQHKTAKSPQKSIKPQQLSTKKGQGKVSQDTKWDGDEGSQSSGESESEPEIPSQLVQEPPQASKQLKGGKKGKAVMNAQEDARTTTKSQAKGSKPQQPSGKKGAGKKAQNTKWDEDEASQQVSESESDQETQRQPVPTTPEPSKPLKGGKKGKAAMDSEDEAQNTTKLQDMSSQTRQSSAKKGAGKKSQNTKWDPEEENKSETGSESGEKPQRQADHEASESSKVVKGGKKGKATLTVGNEGQKTAKSQEKPSKTPQQGGKKGKGKKSRNTTWEEDEEQDAESDQPAQEAQAVKPSKGGKKSKNIVDSDDEGQKASKPLEKSPKAKQQSAKKGQGKKSRYATGEEEEELEPESDQPEQKPAAPSKQSKGGKKGKAKPDSEDEEQAASVVEKSPKTQQQSGKKGKKSQITKWEEEEEDDKAAVEPESDREPEQPRSYAPLIFSKKKKQKPQARVNEPEPETIEVPVKLIDEPESAKAASDESEVDDWETVAQQMDAKKEEKKKSEVAQVPIKGKSSPPPSNAGPDNVTTEQSTTKDTHKNAKKGSKKGRNSAAAAASEANTEIPDDAQLRSPILCIMGHVDTGKTKLLDKIRRTNVQDKEAGGITQQIGATFFPRENLLTQCSKVQQDIELRVPGLLIIDTPGHASFNNLRKRGSSLCDVAILVVDIMHGLEPQTKESIGLLRQRKCPFVIALNKIDRLYGWVACEWQPCKQSMDRQKRDTREEFEERTRKVLLQLTSEEGLNCEIYWRNPNMRKNVSVVPTSAITGEGIPDLLTLIVKLTQQLMVKQIVLDVTHIECTVLEVKTIEGLGTTIDVILISGVLHEGDTIVVCGMNGPIVTSIRALLTPHPMKELRVKGEYLHHESLSAAMGVKIAGNGLEEAVAGTSMMVAKNPHDEYEIELLKDEVQEDMGAIFKSVDKTQEGVYVMASTLGSLEALLDFLKESKIAVAGISIGTVWKLDVKKASTMRERGREEYSVILAFDVKVDPDAEKEAKVLGVKIFSADIIYHLFDAFTKHMSDFKEEQKRQAVIDVVFPCVLTIIPDYVFNKKDPLIMGVRIDDGEVRIGTPLVVFDAQNSMTKLGKIASLELNKKSVSSAHKGQEVCIKITGDASVTYGRHFDHKQKMYSHISRRSIDLMKVYFKEDLEKHVRLVLALKKVLGIV